MSAPLIGMSFFPFLILLILSGFAAAIVHWVCRYRLFNGFDGFIGQWIIGWVGAWIGPYVIGRWAGPVMLWHIYIIPALIGAFAGVYTGTINARILAAVGTAKAHPSSTGTAG